MINENFDNTRTIELRSYRIENKNDLSTSRLPLVNHLVEKNQHKREKKKIEKEFKILNTITNIYRIIKYIYKCLAFDVFLIIYHAYSLMLSCTNIITIGTAIIYFIKYGLTIANSVLYLKVIVLYKDFKKEIIKKKKNDPNKNIIKKVIIDPKKSLDSVPVVLNEPLKGIRDIIFFRFISWHVKFLLYIILIGAVTNLNILDYLNILLLIIEFFLYHLLKFYYHVLLRIEAYKVTFGIEEPEMSM